MLPVTFGRAVCKIIDSTCSRENLRELSQLKDNYISISELFNEQIREISARGCLDCCFTAGGTQMKGIQHHLGAICEDLRWWSPREAQVTACPEGCGGTGAPGQLRHSSWARQVDGSLPAPQPEIICCSKQRQP